MEEMVALLKENKNFDFHLKNNCCLKNTFVMPTNNFLLSYPALSFGLSGFSDRMLKSNQPDNR